MNLSPISLVEYLAVALSLLGVVYSIYQNIRFWLWNILASLLYAWVFFEVGLYSDMELQFFFVALSLYGWWQWNKKQESAQPTWSSPLSLLWGFMAALGFAACSGWLHLQYAPGVSFPFLDAGLTGMSIWATYLASKRKMENWILWTFINLSYVFMYYFKGLNLTALLYFCFVFLSLKGFLTWRKI